MDKDVELVPPEHIERSILLIRGQKVILDRDLARLYGVETRALNQSVRRNIDRFPEDFMFRLTTKEWADLTSEIAMSNAESNRSQFATGSKRPLGIYIKIDVYSRWNLL
jgi:hypothetical protein